MASVMRDSRRSEQTSTELAGSPSELPRFFRRIAQYREEFVLYDDGFRGWRFGYPDIARLAELFAARLRAQGIRKGAAVIVWSESRPGWIIALWGCLLEGAVVVPVEPASSLDLFDRIAERVRPRLLLVGDRVPGIASHGEAPIWRLAEIERGTGEAHLEAPPLFADDVAEIVFTSGTTAEPKGVVITHGNVAAQLAPIDQQFAPYRKYVRPFRPLRILNLLPMSHLFGQSIATFVPPLIPGSVLFISSTSPHEIVRQIRSRRVFILVSVPKVLEVLRDFVVHRFPDAADTSRSGDALPHRWWRYRAIHRMFGWKLACLVSGGAPLSGGLEQFWANLGFVMVQGYGLTETAPVISFSHPFHFRHGTAGKPLAGVDVKIANDGEILVRGDNVTPGYFEAPQQTAEAFRGGWFHTGDFGELDADGDLIIRGRKKEMIVTPEGLKVFPADVEAVLNRLPGVRESAVVGKDQVHAVLVVEPGAHADEIVRQANATLENHQKIRSVSVWTGGELPRTRTTRKLRRGEIARLVEEGAGHAGSKAAVLKPTSDLTGLIEKYAPGRAVTPETTIEELGLSSLDRVELMMDLEAKLDTSIDESAFAAVRKVADLAQPMPAAAETSFPRYNRSSIAKLVRGLVLEGVLLPFTRVFARRAVFGLQNLDSIRGPVIFAANHQSYLDTPVILASLPVDWRRKIAPAMWKEYFDAHFHPGRHSRRERRGNSMLYFLIALLFNAFPIPQTETGARETIRYMGELVEQGWSILIFPEGERTATGEIGRFLPGVGLIASRLQLPVIPIRLEGVNRVLPRDARWPEAGPVEVRVGEPLHLEGDAYPALARRVEEAVRNL
jgi:long-chain acyl-CoA synthetase